MFKIAVVCGGPSLERGISLNSARSLLDHLSSATVDIIPLYVDPHFKFHQLSPAQLYSNTPSDFDFKLEQTATPLDQTALATLLQEVDLVFPAIHGPFGEDGQLQRLLEQLKIPYVGADPKASARMFSKHLANAYLQEHGFPVIPFALLNHKTPVENQLLIEEFFKQQGCRRAIVKPVAGGSSIGVFSVTSPEDAYARCCTIFDQKIDTLALIEPFCQGAEFTVMVVQNPNDDPVALIPTEIETSYSNNEIFDYRRKYLPTANTFYHTPPRFNEATVKHIREQAEKLFQLFKMRDFARLDGWVLNNGDVYFTDFNPITGFEQNSFIFRQASLLGFSHREILHYLVSHACSRYSLHFPEMTPPTDQESKQPVFVLFGGATAERQVSLMSGTNVWLKLKQSDRYEPAPFFYDENGEVWSLPYHVALNHTVEEVYQNCLSYEQEVEHSQYLLDLIRTKLQTTLPSESMSIKPQKMSLDQFCERAQQEDAFVFIALHGGSGENGTLQRILENYGLTHNGSHSAASELCMDKYATRQACAKLQSPHLVALPQYLIQLSDLSNYSENDFVTLWRDLVKQLQVDEFIIKPRGEGCSTGIIPITSPEALSRYFQLILDQQHVVPANTFANQPQLIELPTTTTEFIVEPAIHLDLIQIQGHELQHKVRTGWIELTVGVLEQNGRYHAMAPSITLAESGILSLEEKFQGGTGVNLTPPPAEVLSLKQIQLIQKLVESVAQCLHIQNYARIDLFFNHQTDQLIVIEANSLPGLTPSTVIYHQALSENPPLTPDQFLSHLVESAQQSQVDTSI